MEPVSFKAIQKTYNVSRETFTKLKEFATLVLKWNHSINLVSKSTTPNELWHRHMLDSMQLFSLLPPGIKTVTDFGSGAGFPGITLSLMGMHEVHLVESDKRKCVFLQEAAALSSHTIHIHNERIETLASHPWHSDVVTARALAPLPQLLEWVYPFISPDTVCLFPKGKQADEELKDAQQHWQMQTMLLPSQTAPEATILKLQSIQRRGML